MGGLNGGNPTAAGRILDAALVAFAERGDAATVEEIADAAGVAPQAVEQHFPTMAALREAVNERVIAIAMDAFAGFAPDGHSGDVFEELAQRVTSLLREHPDALRYVGRGAIDGDAGCLGLFDALMAIATTQLEALRAEGRLDPELDIEWSALHVVIFNLSTVLFREAIENHLPGPLLSPEGIARWHAADTELFRRGFLRTGAGAR